jgi:hypothetical protein
MCKMQPKGVIMPKPFAQSTDNDDPLELPGDDSIPARPPGCKPHVPTRVDRDTVIAMVAAGIAIADIAKVRGMAEKTLRRHYHHELENGQTVLNTMVIIEHIKRIKAGDFQAIRWWQQARMGWSEKVTIDDPNAANAMRVVVELVGGPASQAAAPRQSEAETRAPGLRVPGTVVELKGRQ